MAHMQEYLDYEAINARFPGLVSQRRLEALSKTGDFVPFIRLTPRGPALWPEQAVNKLVQRRLAATEIDA